MELGTIVNSLHISFLLTRSVNVLITLTFKVCTVYICIYHLGKMDTQMWIFFLLLFKVTG